MYRITGNVGTL